MNANQNIELLHRRLADDPEFIKACREALQDPQKREEIIYILQHGGLSQSSDHQPA